MSNEKTTARFDSFEGVYCSGFFIPDPSVLTAMCLLFEKIHVLNHLEYVIDFSKRFDFVLPKELKLPEVVLESKEPLEEEHEDPLSGLTSEQRRTAVAYLWFAGTFFMKHSHLVGEVFQSSLFPKGEVFDVQLVKKGRPGQNNWYRVTLNPMEVSTGGLQELDTLVSQGAIPILGKHDIGSARPSYELLTARYLASLLAMKSTELVLPQTKAAGEETILEARERLKDYLPPFWSSMLRLSVAFRARLNEGMAAPDLERECADIIDTAVRPALIDLNQKLLKERRNWFYKIITPVAKGVRVMIAKPPLTTADLVSSGLAVGANVALDVAEEMRKTGAVPQESGLTLLLELDRLVRKLR